MSFARGHCAHVGRSRPQLCIHDKWSGQLGMERHPRTRENCSSPWSSSLITNGLNSFMMKSYPIRRDELGSRLRFVVTWSLGFALRKASNMGDLGCPVPKVWEIQVLWQQKSSHFEQISMLWKPTTLGSIEKVLVWILVYGIFPYAVKSLQASSWNELGLMIFSL